MIENYIHCEPHSAIPLDFALSGFFLHLDFFCIIDALHDENDYFNHVFFLLLALCSIVLSL